MVPVIELRAAIPVGAALGLPWGLNYALCVIGNMLPVPFILLFIRKILDWMKTVPKLAKIALWLEEKASKNTDKVLNTLVGYSSCGNSRFPEGRWTGALVAAMARYRMKYALPFNFLGVLTAGFIMTAGSYGCSDLSTF